MSRSSASLVAWRVVISLAAAALTLAWLESV